MSLAKTMVAAVLVVTWSAVTQAQTGSASQSVTRENLVKATMTIAAIDPTTRMVTLKNEKGEEDSYKAGPEMKRFDEFKVGDKVNVSYYESVVFKLRKPGEASTPASETGAAVAAAKSQLPGGAIATQTTTTVVVKAVDPQTGSITVNTKDGRTVTRKVKDKKNLEGIAVGDLIDVTYTRALLTSVERGK